MSSLDVTASQLVEALNKAIERHGDSNLLLYVAEKDLYTTPTHIRADEDGDLVIEALNYSDEEDRHSILGDEEEGDDFEPDPDPIPKPEPIPEGANDSFQNRINLYLKS